METEPYLPLRKRPMKHRRRFSVSEKLTFMKKVKEKVKDGCSIAEACRELNIHHSLYLRWEKNIEKFEVMKKKNFKAKSLGTGRQSELQEYEQELLRFVFELREQGMGVNLQMLILKISSLSREFRDKSDLAKYCQVTRWLKSHNFVQRVATHESQKDLRETVSDAKDFLNCQRPKLSEPCRHQDYVLNMDQTPVPFTFNSNKTLEVVGARTVNVRKSTSDTKRATFAMTVSASGKVLKPMLVYKGKSGGRIEKRKFPLFPKDIVYACQDNAWMDETVMLKWVEKILKPYVALSPEHVIPIILLDSYRCHMMASVVTAIQDLGVEVLHIPGGCTGLIQPVDVGVNKPFKCHLRKQWERWMLEEGIVNGKTIPPSREQIALWAVSATNSLTTDVIRNSWRHGAYSWFPNES